MDRPNETTANTVVSTTTIRAKRILRPRRINPDTPEVPPTDAVQVVRPRRIVRPAPIKTAAAVEKQEVAKEVLSNPTPGRAKPIKSEAAPAKKVKAKGKPIGPTGQAIAKVLLGMVDPVDEIEVTSTLESNKCILVGHRRKHALWIRFKWVRDHFNGHVVNMICENGKRHQVDGEAIVSLWNANEARDFRKAYRAMISLRARRMDRE